MNSNTTKELFEIFFYSNTEDFFMKLHEIIWSNYSGSKQREFVKYLSSLSKEYINIKKHHRMGMLSDEFVNRQENRINNKLSDLLFELQDINPDQLENIKKTLKITKTKSKAIEDNIKEAKGKISNILQSKNGKLGMIVFDIDEFTIINKVHGLQIGNSVLQSIPSLVEEAIANFKLEYQNVETSSFWLGKDEYTVLSINTNLTTLKKMSDKIRKFFEEYIWDDIKINLRVTISCSYSIINKEESIDNWMVRNLLGIKDAKEKGKNTSMKGHDPFVKTSRKRSKNHHRKMLTDAYNINIKDYLS